ncbi:MAG: MFS transporter [Candidatus Lokiarchaeota archaeon]|nr:MFS transporter [Candidatus Lokiarchaeota archaeon]
MEVSKHQNAQKLERSYRFWPLFMLSFIRTFFYAIYDIALPNYLIFERKLDPSLIGIISAITSIIYVGGPFFGRYLSGKLGMKKVILASWTTSAVMLILSITIRNPIALILIRAVEGFSNGAFWPQIWNYLTSWEKHHPDHKKIDFLKTFNYSWNFGLIAGFALGYVLSYFIDNYFAMIISVSIAILSTSVIFMFEPSERFILRENRAVVVHGLKLTPKDWDEYFSPHKAPYSEKTNTEDSLFRVPLIMCIGGIIFFASTKSMYRFTIPYFFEIANQGSYWIFGIVLFQQVLQMIGLQFIRKFKKMRYGYWIAIVILFGTTITLTIFSSTSVIPYLIPISILNITCGLFFGFIQGVTQRIVLDKGKELKSTKYSMLSEAYVGIAFGIPPIVAGFLYEMQFEYVFFFLIGISVVITGILMNYHFVYMKSEKTRKKE